MNRSIHSRTYVISLLEPAPCKQRSLGFLDVITILIRGNSTLSSPLCIPFFSIRYKDFQFEKNMAEQTSIRSFLLLVLPSSFVNHNSYRILISYTDSVLYLGLFWRCRLDCVVAQEELVVDINKLYWYPYLVISLLDILNSIVSTTILIIWMNHHRKDQILNQQH